MQPARVVQPDQSFIGKKGTSEGSDGFTAGSHDGGCNCRDNSSRSNLDEKERGVTTQPEILISVDGSPQANAALDIGLELAVAQGAAVTLLHVNPPVAAAVYDADPTREPAESTILEMDPILREAAERARAGGIAVSVKLVGGPDETASAKDVLSAVEGIAIARNVDLVVVGSRGQGALSNAVLGSVSHGLLKESDRRILVVGEPQQ